MEIQNFSSPVENISLVCYAHSWNIFQHSERNFVSPHGHVISYMYETRIWLKLWLDLKQGPKNSIYALHSKLSYITTFLVFFAFDSLISLFVLGVFFSIKESYDITNKTCIKQVYKHFLWTTHQKWLVTHHDNNVRLERHHFFITECPNGENRVSPTAKRCYSTNRKRINVMCDLQGTAFFQRKFAW